MKTWDDYDTEALDEMVHEAKAEEAATINNEGREGQIEFLEEPTPGRFLPARVNPQIARADFNFCNWLATYEPDMFAELRAEWVSHGGKEPTP